MTQPLDYFTSDTLVAFHLAAEAKSELEALERLKLQFANEVEIAVLRDIADEVFQVKLSETPTVQELHELRIRCLAEKKRGEGSWIHRLQRSSRQKAEDKVRVQRVSDAVQAFSSMGTHANFIKDFKIKEDLVDLVERIKVDLNKTIEDVSFKKNKPKPSLTLYEWFQKDPSHVNRDFVDQDYVLQIRHLVREQGIELTPEEQALLDRAENNRPTIMDLSEARIGSILGFYESDVGNEALKRLSADLKQIFVPSLIVRVGSVFRRVHRSPNALVKKFNENRKGYIHDAEIRIKRQEGRLNALQNPKKKADQIRAHVEYFKDLHEDKAALSNHPLSKLNLDNEDEDLLQSFYKIVPELLEGFQSEVSQEEWKEWLRVDANELKKIDLNLENAYKRYMEEPNEHLALLQLSKDISAIIPGEGGADEMTAVVERALFLLKNKPEVLQRLMTFYIPKGSDYQYESSMVRRLIEQLFYRKFERDPV
ncbi:MAG: hypothetical protein KDK62_08310 [Chlamydiia bacterium]|nr:hypothetical protein [Chlamydiia bacterium]